MTFVVASNNKRKIKELSDILVSIGNTAISAKEAGISCDPEETADSFYGNALIKATAFKELTDYAVIADDSGLMVEALEGRPGVFSARYASLHPTDDENTAKLLKEMEKVKLRDRTAWFVCSIVAILPTNEEISSFGYTRGYIGYDKRGQNGFGYDPVFYIKGNRSFAELSEEEKSRISHRGRALRKFAFKLRNIRKMKGNI